MSQGTDSKRLVFLHIPKTAGTTFHAILNRQYSEAERFQIDGLDPHGSIAEYRGLDASEALQKKLIHGHCADLLFDAIPEPYSVLTFVRDPIKHLVSSYNYLRRATWNPVHETIKKMKSIDEFFDFRLARAQDSIQARYLAGLTHHHVKEPGSFGPLEIRERAIERLSACDYVFTTDRFDEAVLILQNDWGWRTPFYKSLNVSSGGTKAIGLSERLLNQAREVIEIDLEIYAIAQQTMNRRFASCFESGDFQSRVERFRNTNKRLPGFCFKSPFLLRLIGRDR